MNADCKGCDLGMKEEEEMRNDSCSILSSRFGYCSQAFQFRFCVDLYSVCVKVIFKRRM